MHKIATILILVAIGLKTEITYISPDRNGIPESITAQFNTSHVTTADGEERRKDEKTVISWNGADKVCILFDGDYWPTCDEIYAIETFAGTESFEVISDRYRYFFWVSYMGAEENALRQVERIEMETGEKWVWFRQKWN